MFNRTKKVAAKTVNYGRKVTNYEEIQETGHMIGDLGRRLLPKREVAGREETFANAYQRLGLDEAQLASTHRFYANRFYVFAVAGGIGVAILLHSLVFWHLWTGLMSLGFLAVCAASMFQASFRAFQIEQRELVDISYWAQHPSRWIPGSGPGKPPSDKKRSRSGERGLRVVQSERKSVRKP
jgi:hypothetical protein